MSLWEEVNAEGGKSQEGRSTRWGRWLVVFEVEVSSGLGGSAAKNSSRSSVDGREENAKVSVWVDGVCVMNPAYQAYVPTRSKKKTEQDMEQEYTLTVHIWLFLVLGPVRTGRHDTGARGKVSSVGVLPVRPGL